jgi:hypothetical protein
MMAAAATSATDVIMRSHERTGLGQRFLVVGEGDFSFSRGLVQNQEDASNLTTSTVRSAAETRSRFRGSLANISDLVTRGSTVLHGVDACALRSVDGIRDNYDVVYFTFPFAEASSGTHCAPNDPRHALLVASFLMSASTVLRNEGEICVLLHVSASGVSQFDTWNVEAAAQAAQLEVVGYHEYQRDALFPGYEPHASNGVPFAVQSGRVFVFKRKMNTVYDVFQEELDIAEALDDLDVAAAAAEQRKDLTAARTVRNDRGIALELSRRVILPPAVHDGTSHEEITFPFTTGALREHHSCTAEPGCATDPLGPQEVAAAPRFAEEDATLLGDPMTNFSNVVSQRDAVLARSMEQIEIKRNLIAQVDRELAAKISAMPHHKWITHGDACQHAADGRLPQMVEDIVTAVQTFDLDVAAQEFKPLTAQEFQPAAAVGLLPCLICMEEFVPEELISPVMERRPKVGEVVLARYRPSSYHQRRATVLKVSPRGVKLQWTTVTFEGYTDVVALPIEQMYFTSPSSAQLCTHHLCRSCFIGYLKQQATHRRSQVGCVLPECDAVFPMKQVEDILAGVDFGSARDPASIASLRLLKQARADATLVQKAFCANTDCGIAFDAGKLVDFSSWPKVECPDCSKCMCVNCNVTWHSSISCQTFQQLPVRFRDENDVALLQMAKEGQLRACPSCKELIERQEGDCNWMRCLCGCQFCFGCGAPYRKHKRTSTNVHGTPGCQCELFGAFTNHTDEAAVIGEGVPAGYEKRPKLRTVNRPNAPYQPGKDGVKFHSGMPLLPVPCKFATTSTGCPFGKKCWYRHTGDAGE